MVVPGIYLPTNARPIPPVVIGHCNIWSKRDFTLRPDGKNILLAAQWKTKICESICANIVVYNGPSSQSSPLAWTSCKPLNEPWVVQIPENGLVTEGEMSRDLKGHAQNEGTSLGVSVKPIALSGKFVPYQFQMEAEDGKKETFEWRHNHDRNVQVLVDDWTCGWKLIWLTGPEGIPGSLGYTHTGKEVVVSLTMESSWDVSRCFRVEFRSQPFSGSCQEVWKLVVLTSAMNIFCNHHGK